MGGCGGVVARVDEGSIAARLALKPGDVLLEVNGQAPKDVLEYVFLAAEESLELRVASGGRELVFKVEKGWNEDIGVHFVSDLFDGLKKCENRCTFCFVDQLPPGLRESLYVKDDDYRLSFASGNYITLTNAGQEDMERIKSLRLSPLYVSVHATNPVVRRAMLRSGRAGRIMDQLRDLASASIRFHCQVVVCPGINDGHVLETTIADLSALWPWAASLAVVPVGLTRFRDGLPRLRSCGPDVARAVLVCLERWQKRLWRQLGTRFVYAADEFYIQAGQPLPSRADYEGFPQLENGVGLVRQFLTEWASSVRRLPAQARERVRVGIATGEAAAPVIAEAAAALRRVRDFEASVIIVPNDFLGRTVTVSGLMAGRDLAQVLVNFASAVDVFLVPGHALWRDQVFLDGMTIGEVSRVVGRRVLAVEPRARSLFCVARALILGGKQGGMCLGAGGGDSRQTERGKIHAV